MEKKSLIFQINFSEKKQKKDHLRHLKTKSANIQYVAEENNKQIRSVSVRTK